MKRIGKYIVRGVLGRGGMSKVYKVELPVIGKICALKLLAPDPLVAKLLGMDRLRELFVSEARTMAGLNHPHIITIHDFDQYTGNPFYVMDFFANNLGTMIGETYRTEAPSRRISVDHTLAYTRQTLEGLVCLHDAGICHRDIKPFNLLVTAWDTIKICDFGLSKLRGEKFRGPSNLNVGSPYYAAPEQENDPDSVDPRADLYAVGVIMYRMLTGMLPVQGVDHESYRPPSEHNRDLDPQWDHFLEEAMAPRPQDRFVDGAAMLQALDALERHWQEHKERTCILSLPFDASGPASIPQPKARPRTSPLKLAPREAARIFGLDRLWRPARYATPDYIADGAIVIDRSRALVWQRSGSKTCLGWRQAGDYIDRLNREAFGGIRSWRLPTVDELATLLTPPPQGQALCIAPLFDTRQRWIWSSDRRSFMAAYYVDIQMGFIGWNDFSAPFFVRAVCSDGPEA